MSRAGRPLDGPEREASALAPLDLALGLTLVALLLRPVGDWRVRPAALALAAAGLLLPELRRASALWLGLAGLAGARLLLDWPMADNHAYLLLYWCLAAALALRADDPPVALAGSARLLLGLTFGFAALWKLVLSPDYLDGTFFRVFLVTDPRFEALARWAGGLDAQGLEALRAALAQHVHFPAEALAPPPLPRRLAWLAAAATAWTAGMEATLAGAFLAPPRCRLAALRDALLLVFCAVTYATAPVQGFGWLLLAMGVAQTRASHWRLRAAYLGVFALVFLYGVSPPAGDGSWSSDQPPPAAQWSAGVQMPDVDDLVERIRGEFAANQDKLKQFQTQHVEMHHARKQRMEQLERIFAQLRDVWRPRLEALAKEFGDRVEATPTIAPGRRQASLHFKSPLATIRLRFSAMPNSDVTQLVLAYDLEILPILMEFERHAEVSFPLEQIEPKAVGQWLDDRIVGFVKTYLSLHENEYYLRDQMVDDPVAHVRFPKFAAGATRDRDGKTYYFISEETAAEFEKQGRT